MSPSRVKVLKQVTLRFFNSRERKLSLVLEPWGEVYDFLPSDEIVVVFRGPQEDHPEIDVGEETIAVFGWTGSYASVFKNGVEVRSGIPEAIAATGEKESRR